MWSWYVTVSPKARSQQGLKKTSGMARVRGRYRFRRSFRDDRPSSGSPSGPRSTIQSADLMTSRLCSMTMTVLPLSTRD